MLVYMFGKLGSVWGNRGCAWLGAVCFHLLAGLALLTVTFEPLLPSIEEVMSIELVDMPADESAEVSVPVEEVVPIIEDPSPELAPPAPEPAPSEPPIIAIAPPRAPPAQPEALEEDEEEDVIPPQYLIRRAPMLETAPSASARVSASVMCARTNRETRPAFCPEVDDEDLRFAELARAQGDFGGYSPRDEVIFAGTTFDAYARQQGYETFRDRQFRHRTLGATDGSGNINSALNIRRGQDGAELCSVLQSATGPGAGISDGGPTTNGGSKFCD